jgi:tetratricopeptide (TPR) repeat protein
MRLVPIFFSALIVAPTVSHAQAVDRIAGWRADVDSLVDHVAHGHPNPWAHRSRAEFITEATALRDSVARASDAKMLAGIMRLAASLGDGHTGVTDLGTIGSPFWFPVRFAMFADGLWVTAISPDHGGTAGQRVVAMGGHPVEQVLSRWLATAQGDNAFNRRQHSSSLSNGAVLAGLGIIPRPDTIQFEVVSGTGKRESVTLVATKGKGSLEWYQWGEMYGPPDTKATSAIASPSGEFLDPDANKSLPLHMRARRAYWWTWISESRMLYFQLNAVAGKSSYSKLTLLETWSNALAFADSQKTPVDRFVLDLRYNSGGNGSLVTPMMKALIKHDSSVARPGHFFVLTSGKTFSAAAGFVAELMKYVEPIIVGEPPGAGLNASGDAGHIKLPYSGMVMSVSTRYTQTGPAGDTSSVIRVNVPAPMRGVDYFARRDPALEAILSEPAPFPNVLDVLRQDGGAAAQRLWSRLRSNYGQISWWEPWRWQDLNDVSYELLEKGRTDDAIAGFVINTERNPTRWETWDSLGEAYLKAGKRDDALKSYQRAMDLDPRNWNASEQLRIVTAIRAGKVP